MYTNPIGLNPSGWYFHASSVRVIDIVSPVPLDVGIVSLSSSRTIGEHPGNNGPIVDLDRCHSEIEVEFQLKSEKLFGLQTKISFFLLGSADSKNCCDLNLVAFDADQGIQTYYIFGSVEIDITLEKRFRKEPSEAGCMCPCVEGIECTRRKFRYRSLTLGLITVAHGSIDMTLCADGSFQVSGFGRETDIDFDFKSNTAVNKQKTCDN